MRLAFLGSPEDAVAPLRALVEAGHDVAAVVTRPDRRRSRGGAPAPSPVRVAADELGLPVRAPARAGEIAPLLAAVRPEVGVVVAFGMLLPPSVLAVPPHGLVNLHFSLLPRWRGAAPVERAVLAGDAETGVCLMAVEEGLDTGGVYARVTTPIGAEETAGELRARLVALGAALLVDHLPDVASAIPEPQRGEATYAEKLTVGEFRIDPTRPAAELARLVRAGNPRPGAWLRVAGRRVKVWRSAVAPDGGGADPGTLDLAARPRLVTTDAALELVEVQPEGRRRVPGAEWARGVRGVTRIDGALPGADPAA